MTRLLAVVKREPVRVYLYGILGPTLALLFVYGILSAEQIAAWGALGAAMLAVPAVETARSRVTPADPR